jgi:hypothetical protein
MKSITRADLDQLVKQYQEGLVHEFEFLLQLQLHPIVVERMHAALKLPYRAVAKLSIDDLNNDDSRLPANEVAA